ncbi:LysE family translocator [Pantoea sp. CCBC3-3-1]|uniref:LysE family translocator n=1 Tax=Pantoea sp. CCBC3-3-1 TaxID=2490851 RepID=UPI0011BEE7FB|nr:LysE family translocator [Pantoea sp. CCBC3-3-1]
MLDIIHYPLFVVAVLVLVVTPGPDLAYVIGQSIANGRRSGVISAAGVALGSCAHTVASAVGLTAIIAASPTLFLMVKYMGALYLIWLGSRMIWSTFSKKAKPSEEIKSIPAVSTGSLLSRGFITTITNPKVLLFFIAFFPQFVTVGGEHQALSFVVLGITYAIAGFATDTTFALIAGSAASAVSKNHKLQRWLDRVVGATFISLGVRLALTRR